MFWEMHIIQIDNFEDKEKQSQIHKLLISVALIRCYNSQVVDEASLFISP